MEERTALPLPPGWISGAYFYGEGRGGVGSIVESKNILKTYRG